MKTFELAVFYCTKYDFEAVSTKALDTCPDYKRLTEYVTVEFKELESAESAHSDYNYE
jgi:hypothetical protein